MEPSLRQDSRTAAAASEFVAETRFSGCIVESRWSREAVERVLPRCIRLVTGRRAAHKDHPVLFMFGEHYESAVLFASRRFPTGVAFRELVIAVPFVCQEGGKPRVFLPRVFSGEPVVTWSGNLHYGFPKSMVPMERFGNSFVVTDDRGALLLHAMTEPAGPWERAAGSTLPRLALVVDIGRLPVLGCRPEGTWVTSRFDWMFGDALVRPVRAAVSIDSSVGPGLEPRVCHSGPDDAVEVRQMRWRLSWPETRAPETASLRPRTPSEGNSTGPRGTAPLPPLPFTGRLR